MEYEFQTTIESADVTITFDYQPEESMVLYYSDGSGYPGCAASVDGYGVTFETKQFNSIYSQVGSSSARHHRFVGRH
jgi:hypothetical protein